MKKKLQIFISSTFTDLIEERQAAVEAVLRSGHIPAGMELFSAGNKSQLETIKKWIAQSDIYILILGGRYGSLELESQLSYTEVEYLYAIELEKPFFAIVLDDEFLENKTKTKEMNSKSIYEFENQDKYKNFKKNVLSKVCRICKDSGEIKLSILESILDIQGDYDLSGWVKGDEIPDSSQFLSEISILRNERDELQKKVISLETLTKKTSKNKFIGEHSYEEIKTVLQQKKITVPSNLLKNDDDWISNALEVMIGYTALLTTGVTSTMSNDVQKFLTNKLIPILQIFSLVERQKVKNTGLKMEYDKFVISALGNKFLSIFHLEKTKSEN
jgi:hypothetical protein